MQTEIIKALKGAAGASGDKIYVDDVFSTYLYHGNSTARSIDNGIDLSGEGGMTWIKQRNGTADHVINDTVRGAGNRIRTNVNAANASSTAYLSAFNSDGFSLGTDADVNGSNEKYVSYSFRKAPGFFDVVTYSGSGSAKTVAHSLGSVPGMIIIKCTSHSTDWAVGHRSLNSYTNFLRLNNTGAAGSSTAMFNGTAPTSSVFSVGDSDKTNESGKTYVAYIFAHDEQSFGDAGNASIIKCGAYDGNGGKQDINLGWEPSFVIIKSYEGISDDWCLFDNTRGVVADNSDHLLFINYNYSENDSKNYIDFKPTGFELMQGDDRTNEQTNGGNQCKYIYMAVRRPDGYVGKPAEAGTDVFAMDAGSSNDPRFDSGFLVDMALEKEIAATSSWKLSGRLNQKFYLYPDADWAGNGHYAWTYDWQAGWSKNTGHTSSWQSWMFKRHAGFDVVNYSGTGSAKTVNHTLGKIPEMMWIKNRNTTGKNWQLYHKGLNGGTNPEQYRMRLNTTDAEGDYGDSSWNDTAPTSTVFTVGTHSETNGSSEKYLALLFASVDGISKVGYYTGTGADQTITTGFQPRFVFIKRSDSGENGFVLDTTRGWGSGNDNYLIINSTAAQAAADFGNPVSTGFFVKGTNSGTNTNTGKYIYYAHA